MRWPVAALAAIDAGWMVFDGTRALVVGDYVTAGADGAAADGGVMTGTAGLGPWAGLVSVLGVDPRGTGMKAFFVAYGLCWLVAVIVYLRRPQAGRPAMAIAAAGSLWYLVVGTASSMIQLALLAAGRLARRRDMVPSGWPELHRAD